MKRIPNLETAIDECRRIGRTFEYEFTGKSRIKFFIEGCAKLSIVSTKNDNSCKVRKDIRRLIGEGRY